MTYVGRRGKGGRMGGSDEGRKGGWKLASSSSSGSLLYDASMDH
jgi:hypothetical protein